MFALVKVSSGLPSVCVDVGVSIIYALTMAAVLLSAQNILLTHGSAAVRCTIANSVNLRSIRRFMLCYLVFVAQIFWPVFAAVASERGSDTQVLYSRIHLASVGCAFAVFDLGLARFVPQLRAALHDTMNANLGQSSSSSKQAVALRTLDMHLARVLYIQIPANAVIATVSLVFGLYPPAFAHQSYFMPAVFIFAGFGSFVSLRRSQMLINDNTESTDDEKDGMRRSFILVLLLCSFLRVAQ